MGKSSSFSVSRKAVSHTMTPVSCHCFSLTYILLEAILAICIYIYTYIYIHIASLFGTPEQNPRRSHSAGAEAINSALEKPSQPSLSAEDKQLILNQVILGICWVPSGYYT